MMLQKYIMLEELLTNLKFFQFMVNFVKWNRGIKVAAAARQPEPPAQHPTIGVKTHEWLSEI